MLIHQPSPLNHLRLLNTGRVQTNVLQLKKKTTKHVPIHPSGTACPNPKSSNPSRSIPPSPSPLLSAGRARYATSPQSDAEGRPEDNASGGRVLRAQMAEQRSATSERGLPACPHIISPCFAMVIAARFFCGYDFKEALKPYSGSWRPC